MLMTLALVAPLLNCVGDGTAPVGLDQAMDIMSMPARHAWLVTKSSFQSPAVAQFAGTGVRVTCEGRPYLGAATGSQEYSKKFIDDKVREWSAEVLLLAKIGESQPHAAYSALTHGLSSRWHYVFRAVPITQFLQPLEDVICCTLLPVVLGISLPNDTVLNLVALPPRWGGLGCVQSYGAICS